MTPPPPPPPAPAGPGPRGEFGDAAPRRKGSAYDPAVHGPRRVVAEGFHEQVYAAVRRVPAGRVTTFGDVAGALGLRSVARQVGWALAALPPDRDDVPWFRVVNAQGQPSRRGDGSPSGEQVERLEAEGIRFTPSGRIADFAAVRHRFDDGPPA